MTELEHLQSQKAWAKRWLAVPESDLPGTLTHEKCAAILDEVEDSLIDYLGITISASGATTACYIDTEHTP
jgi:hypothetical protein